MSQTFVGGVYYCCKLLFTKKIYIYIYIYGHTLHIKINALQKKYGHLYINYKHILYT